jgi:hypothetical protein
MKPIVKMCNMNTEKQSLWTSFLAVKISNIISDDLPTVNINRRIFDIGFVFFTFIFK